MPSSSTGRCAYVGLSKRPGGAAMAMAMHVSPGLRTTLGDRTRRRYCWAAGVRRRGRSLAQTAANTPIATGSDTTWSTAMPTSPAVSPPASAARATRPSDRPEDAAGDERAADPRERPDDSAVVLEEAVRNGDGEHREQHPDEQELKAGRAREQSGVHALESRECLARLGRRGAVSSAGQSACLTSRRSPVRARDRPCAPPCR